MLYKLTFRVPAKNQVFDTLSGLRIPYRAKSGNWVNAEVLVEIGSLALATLERRDGDAPQLNN
jgi:hypothetical protein